MMKEAMKVEAEALVGRYDALLYAVKEVAGKLTPGTLVKCQSKLSKTSGRAYMAVRAA